MEAILFIGIPGSGKSTFFKERFFDTHIRINLDMLKTRHREKLVFEACLAGQQSFVVDNSNVSKVEREPYILAAKAAGFRVIGYYFQVNLGEALKRNAQRSGKAAIPKMGVIGRYRKLEPPEVSEGFDELFVVRTDPETSQFIVEKWQHEVQQ